MQANAYLPNTAHIHIRTHRHTHTYAYTQAYVHNAHTQCTETMNRAFGKETAVELHPFAYNTEQLILLL